MDVESEVTSGVDAASKPEMTMTGRDVDATRRIDGVSEVQQAKKDDHEQVQLAVHQLQLEDRVGVVRENSPFSLQKGDEPSRFGLISAPCGELREEESYSEEVAVQHPSHASPSAPILASPIPQDSTKPEIKTPGHHESVSMEPPCNGQRVEGGDVPIDQSPAQCSSQAGNMDVESQRRAGIVGPDQPVIATHRLPDAYAQDSAGSDARHTETDSRPEISLDRRHDVSVPHQTPITSRAHDSRQSVPSVAADVTPEPMVTSPKSINAHDSIPAAASSHQHNDNELQSVVDVSGKSTDPLTDALGLDTREITRKTEAVDGDHEASIIEDHHQDPVPTSTQAENAKNFTDQSMPTTKGKPRHLILSKETIQSPNAATSPSLIPTTEQMDIASPTQLSHRSASLQSELPSEAQADESALSQPSDGSEESLLDPGASTTILASSDKEMLSSHTPRYLNNRKRIRSKNIVKPPPRIAAIKKTTAPPHVERPNGLAAGAIPGHR
ncbi:hypothetical protein PCANC_01053 [Puccinia coronata f. sp. avenae]|uniref:Uncharacterized protein n=1 Tax=Puccinia coronata f. sp. avenae TaxID=200324 RepID=A0A2N5W6G4_9BASI|nr:hypothetical protein PCANC_01053 [Puccinia coronata f. sp. avenae]